MTCCYDRVIILVIYFSCRYCVDVFVDVYQMLLPCLPDYDNQEDKDKLSLSADMYAVAILFHFKIMFLNIQFDR